MSVVSTGINVVIRAQSHNPSIVTKDWLAQNDFGLGEATNFVHTPPFSRVTYADGVAIQVEEPRLMISQDREGIEPGQSVVPGIAKRYVGLLPHIPYTAHGVNFDGYVPFDSMQHAAAFLREKFIKPGSLRLDRIEPDTVLFGLKVRYVRDGGACTLTTEPREVESQARLLLHFNYHVEQPGGDPLKRTMDSIGGVWETFKDAAANFEA